MIKKLLEFENLYQTYFALDLFQNFHTVSQTELLPPIEKLFIDGNPCSIQAVSNPHTSTWIFLYVITIIIMF
jgi:hypothetical protein